jgi:hypothetical protein
LLRHIVRNARSFHRSIITLSLYQSVTFSKLMTTTTSSFKAELLKQEH